MTHGSIYYTLDFEADLGTASPSKTYEAAAQADRLAALMGQQGLPLTVFCEGEILARRFELVRPLVDLGAELELHAFDHTAAYAGTAARVRNLRDGLAAYQDRFGRNPLIYRAPDGVIGTAELEELAAQGIGWDSSVFPTRFPGRFDFSRLPRAPFRIAGLPVVELPFATLGTIRLPIALSYFQLLGPRVFQGLAAVFGEPEAIVFDFHMHDLARGEWRRRPGVSRAVRWGYWRAQAMADPASVFVAVIEHYRRRGRTAEPLAALVERTRNARLPEVRLP